MESQPLNIDWSGNWKDIVASIACGLLSLFEWRQANKDDSTLNLSWVLYETRRLLYDGLAYYTQLCVPFNDREAFIVALEDAFQCRRFQSNANGNEVRAGTEHYREFPLILWSEVHNAYHRAFCSESRFHAVCFKSNAALRGWRPARAERVLVEEP